MPHNAGLVSSGGGGGGTPTPERVLLNAGPLAGASGSFLIGLDTVNNQLYKPVAGNWAIAPVSATPEVVFNNGPLVGAAPVGAVLGVDNSQDPVVLYEVLAGNWSVISVGGSSGITANYLDAAARIAETGHAVTQDEIDALSIFRQADDSTLWLATGTAGAVVWEPIGGSASDIGYTAVYANEAARVAETGHAVTQLEIDDFALFKQADNNTIWLATGTAGAVVWEQQATTATPGLRTQPAHGFTLPAEGFIPVYNDGADWVAGQADNAATVHTMYIVAIPDANTIELSAGGIITATGHGLTEGDDYFLSDVAAGANVTTAPAISAPTVRTVMDANTLYLSYEIDAEAVPVPDEVLASATADLAGVAIANGEKWAVRSSTGEDFREDPANAGFWKSNLDFWARIFNVDLVTDDGAEVATAGLINGQKYLLFDQVGTFDGVWQVDTGADIQLNTFSWDANAAPHTHIAPYDVIIPTGDDVAVAVNAAAVTTRAPRAFTVTAVKASLVAPSTAGLVEVDILANGTSILGTNITIDANEETSVTAATLPVVATANIADDAEIVVSVVQAGTGAIGLEAHMVGQVII